MGKNKPKRDPNAPKRNLSAYLMYQNGMREQFKALNPGMTFGQLSKFTSAMYSDLPPSEKEAWSARAETDKARYLHELASYNPPPGYDPKGDAMMMEPSVLSKSGKRQRDVNAPKSNISAYLLYQNAMRRQFKNDNPGMTFGQLAKYTSHMYKNLTPEEKAGWDDRAAQDKKRYESEIAIYVPPPGHDGKGFLISNCIDRPSSSRRKKRIPKDPSAPKRASGAYVFFTNEMRPQIVSEYPGIKFVELGKVLGERWRALTADEKKKYEVLSSQDKLRFKLEMEQYSENQQTNAPGGNDGGRGGGGGDGVAFYPTPPRSEPPATAAEYYHPAAAAAEIQIKQEKEHIPSLEAVAAHQFNDYGITPSSGSIAPASDIVTHPRYDGYVPQQQQQQQNLGPYGTGNQYHEA